MSSYYPKRGISVFTDILIHVASRDVPSPRPRLAETERLGLGTSLVASHLGSENVRLVLFYQTI